MFIKKLAPTARGRVQAFLLELLRLGYIPYVWSSTRTYQEAENLYNSMPLVRQTVRCIGCDYHFFGFAIDVTFERNGIIYNSNTPKQTYLESDIVRVAKKYGLVWGGDFAQWYDPSHFDYRRHSLQVMEAAAIKKYGSLKNSNPLEIW